MRPIPLAAAIVATAATVATGPVLPWHVTPTPYLPCSSAPRLSPVSAAAIALPSRPAHAGEADLAGAPGGLPGTSQAPAGALWQLPPFGPSRPVFPPAPDAVVPVQPDVCPLAAS
ncbi:MAG: hypothetical protein HYV63_08705 [Candidatus Schekmanbacteria bacterium]|nr:hypothetical protein [Candidatus Schekmanbacteria bacterium]